MRQRTIKVAGLRIGIRTRRTLTIELCADYLCDEPPDFVVSATGQIAGRRRTASAMPTPSRSACTARSPCASRTTTLVVHAAVIEHDGRAYAFAAPSGTGKTTHVQQYLARFGDKNRVICGDKPIFGWKTVHFFAYGTPWNGQEKLGTAAARRWTRSASLRAGRRTASARSRRRRRCPGCCISFISRPIPTAA